MRLITKFFNELTTRELYELLKVRSEIFVVEQNCIYQDLDDIDYESLQVFYEEDGKVLACLRIFSIGEDTIKIGRVLSAKHGIGLGGKVLKAGLEKAISTYNPKKIVISAQCYATGYYEREGFTIRSEEYLEDGIPHVRMELDL